MVVCLNSSYLEGCGEDLCTQEFKAAWTKPLSQNIQVWGTYVWLWVNLQVFLSMCVPIEKRDHQGSCSVTVVVWICLVHGKGVCPCWRKCVTVGVGFQVPPSVEESLLLNAVESRLSWLPLDQDAELWAPPQPCLPVGCCACHDDDNELNLFN